MICYQCRKFLKKGHGKNPPPAPPAVFAGWDRTGAIPENCARVPTGSEAKKSSFFNFPWPSQIFGGRMSSSPDAAEAGPAAGGRQHPGRPRHQARRRRPPSPPAPSPRVTAGVTTRPAQGHAGGTPRRRCRCSPRSRFRPLPPHPAVEPFAGTLAALAAGAGRRRARPPDAAPQAHAAGRHQLVGLLARSGRSCRGAGRRPARRRGAGPAGGPGLAPTARGRDGAGHALEALAAHAAGDPERRRLLIAALEAAEGFDEVRHLRARLAAWRRRRHHAQRGARVPSPKPPDPLPGAGQSPWVGLGIGPSVWRGIPRGMGPGLTARGAWGVALGRVGRVAVEAHGEGIVLACSLPPRAGRVGRDRVHVHPHPSGPSAGPESPPRRGGRAAERQCPAARRSRHPHAGGWPQHRGRRGWLVHDEFRTTTINAQDHRRGPPRRRAKAASSIMVMGVPVPLTFCRDSATVSGARLRWDFTPGENPAACNGGQPIEVPE